MDSKNANEALSAMEGLGFDDASKVALTCVPRACFTVSFSEGNTISPRAGPKTGSSPQPAPRIHEHVLGQVEAFLPDSSFHISFLLTDASLGHPAAVLLAAKKLAS